MFSHLLKITWNRKGKNLLLIAEIMLSFIVVFAVLSFALYNFNNFFKARGYEYENVWAINIGWGAAEEAASWSSLTAIEQQLQSYPEIESFSLTQSAYPYSFSNSTSNFKMKDVQC